MKIITIRRKEDGREILLNLDHVTSAIPEEDGWLTVRTTAGEHVVDERTFMESLADAEGAISEMRPLVNRLVEALNRLTVHIPTSIRMHL